MISKSVSVACPLCRRPAVVSIYVTDDETEQQVLQFSCPGNHQVDPADVVRLWTEAHR